jgi:uncharacterized protein YhdP
VQQCTQLAGRIEGRIKVDHKKTWDFPRIKKSEFSVRDVSVTHNKLILPLSVDEAEVKIDEAGKISLNGTGLWGKSYFKAEETFFSGEVELLQYPVRRLIETFYPESKIIEADMTLQGSFNMKGTTARELISGLNGTFDLQLSQGWLNNKSIFFKILNIIDVKRILFRRNPDLSRKGLHFDSILGHIDIDNGTMMLKDFQMKTSLFNAVGSGKIDLENETVDSVIGVEPLSIVTEQVDKIPLSGYVLSNEVKSMITYHFYVKGPLSDPEVKYLSPTELTKDMIRDSKRLFLAPARLFKGRAKEKK